MTDETGDDRRIVHGVLTAVFGRGTLIRGVSGAGKSVVALTLVSRGHRFVADDTVRICRRDDALYGASPELTTGVLAVDELGLVDIAAVFGKGALQAEARIDICVEMSRGLEPEHPDILSAFRPVMHILGVSVPVVRLDVSKQPANPVMIETAVRMLEHPSADLARHLSAEHDSSIIQPFPIPL